MPRPVKFERELVFRSRDFPLDISTCSSYFARCFRQRLGVSPRAFKPDMQP